MRIGIFGLSSVLTSLVAAPGLVDRCEDEGDAHARAEIVVVGVLTGDSLVKRPIPRHSDPRFSVQLRRLTVRVEQVLRGGPVAGTISVLYFTEGGGFTGNARLGMWSVGARRALWLQREAGSLRLSCDCVEGCTRAISSGAHPGYRVLEGRGEVTCPPKTVPA